MEVSGNWPTGRSLVAGLQFLGDSGPLRPLPLGQRHDDLAGLQLLGHARFGEHFRGLALRWPREYYRYYYLSYQSSVRSRVFSCTACHWWALHESGIGFSATDHWVTRDDAVHWGKIKEFDVAAAALPVDALRRQLAARGASLPAWPPTALAPLVSSCFSEFFACAAIPVGGSGDDGIDVILLDAADPLLLEVRRSADPASGKSVQVVTELLGVAWRPGRCDGIVVSTANRYLFPDQQKKALRGTSIMEMGHRIKLHDDAIFVDVLARTLTPTERP